MHDTGYRINSKCKFQNAKRYKIQDREQGEKGGVDVGYRKQDAR